MSEQFPDQPTEALVAEEQQVNHEQLAAEHAQAVRTEVKLLHAGVSGMDRMSDMEIGDDLQRLIKHSESDTVTSLPGAKEAVQGIVVGAAKDPTHVGKYYSEAIRKSFLDDSESSQQVVKVLDNVIGAQDRGVQGYRMGPEAETMHRQSFAGGLENAIKTLNSKEGLDKAQVAKATVFIRGVQMGSSTPDQRHSFTRKLEETLIEA